ncbi:MULTISPECIES: hypothetical protein [unclassified Caballeronia]|uniref:hypothetical protein n=1 Tax=unclassified Caballeronia TaxID=2646786 RepID=UPI002028CD49|nr:MULTISPECIES: hypothetical protein [unclassified Caballeronia]MDR5766157.1 hypothetical protein [Caballeronia sp. LZ028]
MKILLAGLFLVAASLASMAAQTGQWNSLDKSMYQLINDGFRLVSTSLAPDDKGIIYFLQRGQHLVRCAELHNGSQLMARCEKLVSPY